MEEKCICCNNTNNDETEGNLADAKISKKCNNIYKLAERIKIKKCKNLIYWDNDVDSKFVTFFKDGVTKKKNTM